MILFLILKVRKYNLNLWRKINYNFHIKRIKIKNPVIKNDRISIAQSGVNNLECISYSKAAPVAVKTVFIIVAKFKRWLPVER